MIKSKQPIDVAVDIDLPPEQVWDYVKDISSHTEWMRDATAIRITSDSAIGAGTTFECDTKIGPFKLVDKMEITEWTDNEYYQIHAQNFYQSRFHIFFE